MKKTQLIIVLIIIIVITALITKYTDSSATITYIDIAEVFENFELKKELTKEYEKVTLQKDEILNGMYMELEKLNASISSDQDKVLIEDYQTKRQVYLQKKNEFDSQNAVLLDKYDNQVFTQLNQYVKEYGEKHDIDAIIGANGQGSLMYGKENMNITKEVIEYINNRYKGKEDEQ